MHLLRWCIILGYLVGNETEARGVLNYNCNREFQLRRYYLNFVKTIAPSFISTRHASTARPDVFPSLAGRRELILLFLPLSNSRTPNTTPAHTRRACSATVQLFLRTREEGEERKGIWRQATGTCSLIRQRLRKRQWTFHLKFRVAVSRFDLKTGESGCDLSKNVVNISRVWLNFILIAFNLCFN